MTKEKKHTGTHYVREWDVTANKDKPNQVVIPVSLDVVNPAFAFDYDTDAGLLQFAKVFRDCVKRAGYNNTPSLAKLAWAAMTTHRTNETRAANAPEDPKVAREKGIKATKGMLARKDALNLSPEMVRILEDQLKRLESEAGFTLFSILPCVAALTVLVCWAIT